MEDLKESIAEVSEMEQIRIECEYPPPPRVGLSPPCCILSALHQTEADEARGPKSKQALGVRCLFIHADREAFFLSGHPIDPPSWALSIHREGKGATRRMRRQQVPLR